jgi:hypothetical protein
METSDKSARVTLQTAAVSAMLLATTGCASVRVDEAGRTHIAGLVWLTLPPAADASASAAKAADVVRARTVGVTLQRTPEGGALVLGYSDAMLSTIYNDSSVRLPPDAPTEPKAK